MLSLMSAESIEGKDFNDSSQVGLVATTVKELNTILTDATLALVLIEQHFFLV